MNQGMVAFLAGMGGGYLQGKERSRRQQQEEEDRAAAKEDRDFIKAERDRVVATRNRLADAAAPVTMQSVLEKPDYADNRDVGHPGVELIDTGAKRVGQQTFAPDQQEQAQTALAEANKPGAATMRMADVLARSGDPVAAQNLRTGARQERLGELQLDEAERAALNRRFDESLDALPSHEAIAAAVSNSGLGGATKLRAVPSADGKSVTYMMTGEDGKEVTTAYTFDNTAAGMTKAKAILSKGIPTAQKLDFLFKESADRRAEAQQQETVRHNKQVERIASDKTAATIEMASMRAAAADRGREAKAGDGAITMADLKEGHKAIAATLNADYKTQIESETDPTKAKAIKTARETETAMVQRLFTGAAQAGIAMTPEQAIAAFRTGELGKQTFKTRDGGTQQVDVIRVGNRTIPLIDEPGFASAPKAVPKAVPTPAASVPVGMQEVARAAPAPVAVAAARPATPPGMQQTGDSALNAIRQQNLAAMQPLNEAVVQARQQLAAVAKSGDPQSLSRYAAALQQAIDKRAAAAEKFFGNSAPQYLASVGQ